MFQKARTKCICLGLVLAMFVVGMCHQDFPAHSSFRVQNGISKASSTIDTAKTEASRANPTEITVTGNISLVPVKLCKRSTFKSIYKTVLGLVLVEYLPQISSFSCDAIEETVSPLSGSLAVIISYMHLQDGEK